MFSFLLPIQEICDFQFFSHIYVLYYALFIISFSLLWNYSGEIEMKDRNYQKNRSILLKTEQKTQNKILPKGFPFTKNLSFHLQTTKCTEWIPYLSNQSPSNPF